jgi:hypothetical protein
MPGMCIWLACYNSFQGAPGGELAVGVFHKGDTWEDLLQWDGCLGGRSLGRMIWFDGIGICGDCFLNFKLILKV